MSRTVRIEKGTGTFATEAPIIEPSESRLLTVSTSPTDQPRNLFGETSEYHKPEIYSLKYTDGTPIIDSRNPDKHVLYYLLTSDEKIYKDKQFKNRQELLFSHSAYDQGKISMELRLEAHHIPIEVKQSIYKCRRCQSSNTISSSKQQRSADEGETIRVVCISCDHVWTFNS